MKKFKFSIGHLLLFIIVAGLMAANALVLYQMQHKVGAEKKAVEDAAKPTELTLTVLSAPACTECFDVNNLITPLKSNEKIKITSEQTVEYASDEGVALIAKYGIAHVPTLILAGDTAKAFDEATFIQNLGKKADDGALVVTNVPPPFLDVASGAVKGKFSVTYLTDKNCKECYDPTAHRQALAGLAMTPTEEKFIDRAEAAGRELIAKYKILSAPTILISGELDIYPRFLQIWPQVGTTEKDGTYVFRAGQSLMGVYHDLKTGKIVKAPLPEQEAPTAPQPQQ